MRVIRGIAALAVVFSISCGGGGDSPTTPGGTNNNPGGGAGGGGGGGGPVATNAVTVNDNFFEPASAQVSVNTTVTWTWKGQIEHNVTFNNTALGTSGNKTT